MQEMLIITILVLVVAYIAFVVLFPKAIPDEPSKHTRDALEDIYNESRQQQQEQQSVLKGSLDEESLLSRGFFALPLIKDLYPLVLQAGLMQKTEQVVLAYALLTILIVFGVFAAGVDPLLALAAPIVSYLLLKKYLLKKVKKRNEKFINGFPDVLDMFVRSVKSGFPVTTAFRMVAENTESPIREEFQQIVSELAIGQSVNQSLLRLAHRINEPDIHFFVVVMKVQQETGGNLAEVVTNLSNIIRKRKQLRLKIKAMTSEGRATAMILGSLPVIVFAALFVVSRDYIETLWTTTNGMIMLGIAIALVVGAVTVVNKMIDIDI